MPLVPGYPCSVPGYPWSVPGYPQSVPACPESISGCPWILSEIYYQLQLTNSPRDKNISEKYPIQYNFLFMCEQGQKSNL